MGAIKRTRTYLPLDISIDREGDHYRVHVLRSAAGEGISEITLPFTDTELENLILKVINAQRRGFRKVRGSDSPELAAAKEFGERLFGAVFQGDIYACLRATLDEARQQGGGVRLLLRLSPDLNNLPWEYLYNPAWNQFLALSTETPLIRYLETSPPLHPLAVKLPLRLLVMISNPTDYEPLDVEREWANLQTALAPLIKRGVLQVERLETASLLELQRKLRKNEYHIFHYIGHGNFDESQGDGVLVFTDETGKGKTWGGQYLGTLLRDHASLRLAVLNACEGARTGADDPFAGVAGSLVQMGLPAVIAMQFEISDSAAVLFAEEFYGALADGYPVDNALVDARKALFASGSPVEWGTPVLFTRLLDGQVFDLALAGSAETDVPDEPAPAEQVAIDRLYEDGLSALFLEDWERARTNFQAVLERQPAHRLAANRLEQIERQQVLAENYAKALAAIEAGNPAEAIKLLESLAAEQPPYKDVAEQLEKLRAAAAAAPGGLAVEVRYRLALDTLAAAEYAEVKRLMAEIQAEQPNYRDTASLLAKANLFALRQQIASKVPKDLESLRQELVKLSNVQRGAILVTLIALVLVVIYLAGGFTWLGMPKANLDETEIAALTPRPALTATSPVLTTTEPVVLAGSATPTPSPTLSTPLPSSQTPTLAPTMSNPIDNMPMLYITGGTFLMGCNPEFTGGYKCESDELPEHKVTVDDFWIDLHEVTNAQYRECVFARGCLRPEVIDSSTRPDYYDDLAYANFPVSGVTWYMAADYCRWAGKRLPTEAEWELAAGGLTKRTFPWGDFAAAPDLANYAAGDAAPGDTTEVGAYPEGASPYGALDMAGNVREWVQDWWVDHYAESPGIQIPEKVDSGTYKVLRGGYWGSLWQYLRVAARNFDLPERANETIGFRCAADL